MGASFNLGIIERGGTAKGGTAKMHSWTRVRRNDAFGSHARGLFVYTTVETKHFDTYQNRLGYISATYQCAPALCLEAVPEGYPPPAVPPLPKNPHPPNLGGGDSPPPIWGVNLQNTCFTVFSSAHSLNLGVKSSPPSSGGMGFQDMIIPATMGQFEDSLSLGMAG